MRAGQAGVAIVSVLLVVALITIIVAGLFVREHVAIRMVENRQALAQSRWIERMAIDWGRFVLRGDALIGRGKPPVDHYGELWATRVDETVLDETVTAGARMDQLPRLQGQVTDAQGLFNLYNLVGFGISGQPEAKAVHQAAFRRLLAVLDLPDSLADLLTARLLRSVRPVSGGFASEPRMLRVDNLHLIRGFDETSINRLAPHVVFLPPNASFASTLLNLHTVTPEVLAAYADIGLAVARQATSRREARVYVKPDDARTDMGLPGSLDGNLFSVASSFFIVRGMVRFGRVENELMALLERGAGNTVKVLWEHRF